jgi:hypothetical protein
MAGRWARWTASRVVAVVETRVRYQHCESKARQDMRGRCQSFEREGE